MRVLMFWILGALLLGGAFVYFRERAEPLTAPPQAAPPVPTESVVELVVQKRRLVSGPAVIQVKDGTPIVLKITTDADDEFHLHGYDRELRLRAGQTAVLKFVADRSGRFEYELHHAHRTLGVLEVTPR